VTTRANVLTERAKETDLRETSVAATVVSDMLQYLEQRGISASTAKSECGIAFDEPSGSEDRVPGSQVERLWAYAIHQTGDPIIGLHMAELYSQGALDILGYVVLSCRTIGDVLDRVSRYAALLNDGMHIEFVRERKVAYCRCTYLENLDNYLLRNPDQAVDTTWAGLARELGRLTTKPLTPVEVWFRHEAPAPAHAKEYLRLLGAPVKFGASEDRFVLDIRHLAEPVRSANPALLQVFEQHADAVLSRMECSAARSRQVAQLLARNLKGAVPQLSEVARELAMSDRNLQRALRNDGTTFQRLLDEVRRDLAISHLANPSTSTGQVGFLLGFSEPSAFHRAFRRWTGKAPSAYRQSKPEVSLTIPRQASRPNEQPDPT
jgi:AraC-like DNA-binding protein